MKPVIKNEALGIANGLYSMNAANASWYAFCHNGSELVTGEFVFSSEGLPTIDRFDGYVDLKTNKVHELK